MQRSLASDYKAVNWFVQPEAVPVLFVSLNLAPWPLDDLNLVVPHLDTQLLDGASSQLLWVPSSGGSSPSYLPAKCPFLKDIWGQITHQHTAALCAHCSIPLLYFSVEASSNHHWSAPCNCPSHTVSQGPGKKSHLPSPLLRSLSSLSPWVSGLTSDPCWAPGTHLPPSLPHVAIFYHQDTKSWEVFSTVQHSATFLEISAQPKIYIYCSSSTQINTRLNHPHSTLIRWLKFL